jgi:single-strand DNA-binding protein
MPTLFGLARVGRDAEVRRTPNGDAVANISLAFNYGRKGDDGKRPTQWVDASMWGQRAEALAPYLLKGQAVAVTIDEAHIETFQRADGSPGSKMVGRIAQIELAGGRPEGAAPAARSNAPTSNGYADAKSGRAPAPKPKTNTGFDDMDDDIPF